MADDPRPPVAIRITRPYATEDEYLEQELDLLSRTGITLVGAQPRPQGVVLRFELVLSAGQVLLRGEGRVVGFKPSAHQGTGGLTSALHPHRRALEGAARQGRRAARATPPVHSPGPVRASSEGRPHANLQGRQAGRASFARRSRGERTGANARRQGGADSSRACCDDGGRGPTLRARRTPRQAARARDGARRSGRSTDPRSASPPGLTRARKATFGL